MALRFLFDEHLRGWPFRIVQRHNAKGLNPINVICIGDKGIAPPLGSSDPELLLWAESAGRIVVTRDERTMPVYLAAHLASGHRPVVVSNSKNSHDHASAMWRVFQPLRTPETHFMQNPPHHFDAGDHEFSILQC